MENNNFKLGKFSAIALILLIMMNKLILNVPYYIVNLVGTGTIVNIIYVCIIDFIFLLIIIKLFENFENQDLIDILDFLNIPILKNLIGIISICLLFIFAAITIIDFSNVLCTIYFYNFSNIYIVIFFILSALFANFIGFKSISNIISFIVPFSILSIIITFLATANDFDITTFTPVLGKDLYTTFALGLSNSFSMYFIIYIYFLKPLLKNQSDYKRVTISSFFICTIILLLTAIPMLTLYSNSNDTTPINSLFLLARQIELGNFIQRVDALFIFLWILSIFSYLSFIIFLINRILKKLTNASNEKMLSLSTCSILLGLSLIPFNVSYLYYIENTVYKYLTIGFMFGLGIIILIFANIKLRKVKKYAKK